MTSVRAVFESLRNADFLEWGTELMPVFAAAYRLECAEAERLERIKKRRERMDEIIAQFGDPNIDQDALSKELDALDSEERGEAGVTDAVTAASSEAGSMTIGLDDLELASQDDVEMILDDDGEPEVGEPDATPVKSKSSGANKRKRGASDVLIESVFVDNERVRSIFLSS